MVLSVKRSVIWRQCKGRSTRQAARGTQNDGSESGVTRLEKTAQANWMVRNPYRICVLPAACRVLRPGGGPFGGEQVVVAAAEVVALVEVGPGEVAGFAVALFQQGGGGAGVELGNPRVDHVQPKALEGNFQ